jgi:predicted Zn-dependent peptidase
LDTQGILVNTGAGLKLVCQSLPCDSVSVDIWIGAGSAMESEEVCGVAHLLEHLIFRGTEFDCLIESQGGISNAATSLDYTHFSFTVPNQGLWTALPYLANMLTQPQFSEIDFAQEKMVVLEEVYQCEDDPDWCAYQILQQSAYGTHPYGRSVLGKESDVQKLTLSDAMEFHHKFYNCQDLTIAVVGGVDVDLVNTIVQESFVNLRTAPVFDCPPPTPHSTRRTIHLEHLQHSRLMISWLGTNASSWKEGLKLDVLAGILAGGRSSRLWRLLREDLGWVYDIDCSFALQRHAGLFTISACLDVDYLEPVEHCILQAVEDLASGNVTPAELQRAKRSLLNSFIFSMESPPALASYLGYHTMLGCDELCQDWANSYRSVVESVQIADVQQLAHEYLTHDRSILISAVAV